MSNPLQWLKLPTDPELQSSDPSNDNYKPLKHRLVTRTSGKLPFECQKIAKTLTFFSKKLTKILFFKKFAIFRRVRFTALNITCVIGFVKILLFLEKGLFVEVLPAFVLYACLIDSYHAAQHTDF